MNQQTTISSLESTAQQLDHFLTSAQALALTELDPKTSALVIVDMINGFVKEGPLAAPLAQQIIAPIASLLTQSIQCGRDVVAFADEHDEQHPEFSTYPIHCLRGTNESALVEELALIGGYTRIPKNSTNGFLAPQFQTWLQNHKHITTYIIVGTCTDICVEQFALTLKAYFNEANQISRLIVPMNAVATYDAPHHPSDLMNALALSRLQAGGVEIIQTFLF